MTRLGRYVVEVLLLVIGVEAILLAPGAAMTVIVVALPLVLVGSGVSILYLRRIYLRQPEPRSRFFGMLVSISARVEVIGLWVGYLVLGRIGQRTGWYNLPTPPPEVSSPISGLVIAIFAAPPIAYAISVWRVRRAARRIRDEVEG